MSAHEKVIGYVWPSGNMYRDLPVGSCDADRALVQRCTPLMHATPVALAADDLLEALRAILAHYEKPAGFDKAMLLTDGEFGEFLKGVSAKSEDVAGQASAAIAKATGSTA